MDSMFEKSVIETKLSKMYDQYFVADNDICIECREKNKGLCRPVSAWFVGKCFHTQSKRILFVGKNASGFQEEVKQGYNEEYECSRGKLRHKGWAYWNYTKDIIAKIYPDDSLERTAITNIVKCNNSNSKDTTSDSMKAFCITQLGMIKKEIGIIKPTHIVFYTSWNYDAYIASVFDSVLDPGDMKQTKKIGNYNSPWCEGIAMNGERKIFYLRTCHPERKNKSEFTKAVIEWINASS